MHHRRWLAFFIVLCLLGGAFPLPSATLTLVCRMTGQPMQPILHQYSASPRIKKAVEAAEARMPCCVVKEEREASGNTHLALAAARSCCDLRIVGRHAQFTPSLAPFVLDFAVALSSAPAVLRLPFPTEIRVQAPICFRPSAPRAPPYPSASLRAPPVFS